MKTAPRRPPRRGLIWRIANTHRRLREYWRDPRGAVAPVAAMFAVIVIGIAGFTIDIGHVMYVQRKLQTSADAAAMAGAALVAKSPAEATQLAYNYSAKPGSLNSFRGAPVTANAVLKCLNTVAFPTCSVSAGTYNAIQVTQTTQVPMWFSQVLGISTMTVVATSTASAKGGSSLALDVMVVMDRTPSMENADTRCTGGGPTRLACAKRGIQALLTGLNPAKDRIGIMVFPGFTTKSGALSQSSCNRYGSTSRYGRYSDLVSPYYMVASLANNYMTGSGADAELDPMSPLAIAAGAGSCSGGSSGIQSSPRTRSQGGVNTYFAEAIKAATAELTSHGNDGSQKVIVFLSDGDANAIADDMLPGIPASDPNILIKQCKQAKDAADVATAQGMWVYSVAYGASTAESSCSTDTGTNKSACWAMKKIASDSSKFYSDGANGCIGTGGNDSDLVALFQSIAQSLTRPRLIPNSST